MEKIKVNPGLSSFSGRRGVGLGSPFLQVPAGRRAGPSYAQRAGLQPSITERTFKQEQSPVSAEEDDLEGFQNRWGVSGIFIL